MPKGVVPKTIFETSYIFTERVDRYSGDDYVRGEIEGVKIEFSDILAKKIVKDSKGRNSEQKIFDGLFIRAEFNKHFKGKTVVLPDTAQKFFGDYIGSILQSKNFSRDKLVKMDNPAFEKEFVVYSSDQIEARYILTHSMMERILRFKKKVKNDIAISFVYGFVHIAIHKDNSLEPTVFSSLLEYKIVKEYVETLYFALGIVEELKLNEKLWSKG